MPALTVVISGNADLLKKEMAAIDAMAKRTGKNITTSLRGDAMAGAAAELRTGGMREVLVLMREIGRGNWTRVPGSISILVQQFGLLKYVLNPIAIGLGAIGTAAFFLIRNFRQLSEETKNLQDLLSTSNIKFSEQAEAMDAAADAAEKAYDWLGKLTDKQDSLAESTDDVIKAMREQAGFERELAAAKGATPQQITAMELAEKQKEVDYLKKQADAAKDKLGTAKVGYQEAVEFRQKEDQSDRIKDAEERLADARKVVDQIQTKIKAGETVSEFHPGGLGTPAGYYTQRPLGPGDRVSGLSAGKGKLPPMSLNEAIANVGKITGQLSGFQTTQKNLESAVSKAQGQVSTSQSSYDKLSREYSTASGDLALRQKYQPQIDAAQKAKEGGSFLHGSINAAQRIGAYTPGAVYASAKHPHDLPGHLNKLEKLLANIAKNTEHGRRADRQSVRY